MNSVKNSVKIFSFATLLSIVLSSCSGTPPIVPSDSPQIIPYSESRMAEFSKELSETSEIYIESNNGLRKTVIDLQSGNSYDETTENGTLNKTYFLNQSEGTVPVGVYRLFEKDQLHCYYPIEGDATIDLYKLLIDSNDAKKHNVQVNYDGCNGVQREHNKKLNNGLPILHKVPPKRDYGRYFCIMAEKGGTSHGGLTEKLSPFFHAKKQEVNAYGR